MLSSPTVTHQAGTATASTVIRSAMGHSPKPISGPSIAVTTGSPEKTDRRRLAALCLFWLLSAASKSVRQGRKRCWKVRASKLRIRRENVGRAGECARRPG